MNPPLNDDARRIGGLTRDKGRPDWEKSFMGAVAGAARPLKKDHPAASDPKAAARFLKDEAGRFPWIILSIVGRDGRSVRSTLSESEIEARINKMGGSLGLAGLVLLRGRLVTYVRPFVSGIDVEERLTNAMTALEPIAFGIIRDELEEAEKTRNASPVSARVYSNGKRFSIFYSWEPEEAPEQGWELAGILYLVRATSGNWKVQTQTASLKWTKVIEQAAQRFETKMGEVQKALRGIKLE
jgi:hypothetical protein